MSLILCITFLLGTLYIRRRSQLLREKSKQDVSANISQYSIYIIDFNTKCKYIYIYYFLFKDMIPGMRRKYLRIRSAILQNRYNVNFDMQSNSACSQSTSLVNIIIINSYTIY